MNFLLAIRNSKYYFFVLLNSFFVRRIFEGITKNLSCKGWKDDTSCPSPLLQGGLDLELELRPVIQFLWALVFFIEKEDDNTLPDFCESLKFKKEK